MRERFQQAYRFAHGAIARRYIRSHASIRCPELRLRSKARLTVGFSRPGPSNDLCKPSVTQGYLGAENQAIAFNSQPPTDSFGATIMHLRFTAFRWRVRMALTALSFSPCRETSLLNLRQGRLSRSSHGERSFLTGKICRIEWAPNHGRSRIRSG